MRLFLIASVFALIASGADSQNPVQSPANEPSPPSCLPVMPDLRYPAAALASNIMGPVSSAVDIDSSGNVTRLEPKGHPLLVAGVQEALRTASFNSGCRGQTVAMRFNFRLDQALDPSTPVSVKAVSAYEFEIVAPAKVIISNITCPIFTRKGRILHHVRSWLLKLRFW